MYIKVLYNIKNNKKSGGGASGGGGGAWGRGKEKGRAIVEPKHSQVIKKRKKND